MAWRARFTAPFARVARDRRAPRPVRKTAGRAWLPAARLYGRFRFHIAARLLSVLGGIAGPSYRLFPLRGGSRSRQAGDLVRGKAALRRRTQTWRTLFGDIAGRLAVRGQGNAREVGRVHDLCARPEAI